MARPSGATSLDEPLFVIQLLSFDLETWALVNAVSYSPEDNARALALLVTDAKVRLPERFDLMAKALGDAIHTHTGAEAAFRFRKAHDWWKTELCKGEWEEI